MHMEMRQQTPLASAGLGALFPSLHVRKLDILGCKTGTFYFEYPKLTSVGSNFMVEGDFQDRVLTKIEACVGVGVYSIKLGFSDGTSSPLIGGRDPTNIVDLLAEMGDESDPLKTVKIRAWNENYI